MSQPLTVEDLVRLWRASEMPVGWSMVSACRARLFTAAVHTIGIKANQHIPYDPLRDVCFQWASQWLAVADGDRKSIEDSLEHLVSMRLSPPPAATHKHHAAGDAA
jgi:hypothetical protein